jgi:hypothetical protein
MNTTALELRRNLKNVLAALGRNERVTLTYRGQKKAVIVPWQGKTQPQAVEGHPAFGMWKDRADVADVEGFVRKLRRARQF